MGKEGQQQLFLMEFLVDRVNVPAIRAMHEGMLPAMTCVSFQILSLPVITIHQDDPSISDCNCQEDEQSFRKGKSCLFALPTIVLEKPLYSFPVTMSVYKKLPPGVLPDVMLIGTHQIETKDLINSQLKKQILKKGKPGSSLRDTFKIKTATGQHVGEATVFVRASCFGPKIVTQFQIPHNRKPYLFKGAADSPVFQCKKIPSDLEEKIKASNNPKCSCQPEKQNNIIGESQKKTCCSLQPPPPPPTPENKGFELASSLGLRPCCPSSRGQRCPAQKSHSINSQQNISKFVSPANFNNAPRASLIEEKKCGCSK